MSSAQRSLKTRRQTPRTPSEGSAQFSDDVCIDEIQCKMLRGNHILMNPLAILLYVSLRTNASLNHFLVLNAIARGFKTADKIAKVTRLGENEVG